MTKYVILNEDEISLHLKELPDWKIDAGQLTANFVLPDFKQAMAFINLIAFQAERLDHHPTWSNTYNKVTITLSTHDADNKITDLDISLAKSISEFSRKFC